MRPQLCTLGDYDYFLVVVHPVCILLAAGVTGIAAVSAGVAGLIAFSHRRDCGWRRTGVSAGHHHASRAGPRRPQQSVIQC